MRTPMTLIICLGLFATAEGAGRAGPGEVARPGSARKPSTARALVEQGRYREAVPVAREWLRAAEANPGPDSVEAADAIDLLVEVLCNCSGSRDPATRQLAERALHIHETAYGPDDPRIAASLHNLASIIEGEGGDLAAARALHERALKIREAALGPDDLAVADSLLRMCWGVEQLGDVEDAMRLAERSLAVRRAALGDADPRTASAKSGLAWAYYRLGRYKEADELYQSALAVLESTPGPESIFTARAWGGYASLLKRRGDEDASLAHRERAIAAMETALGPDSPEFAGQLVNFGWAAVGAGDPAGALAALQRALPILERTQGPDHPWVAITVRVLSEAQQYVGDLPEAEVTARRALELHERIFGPMHEETAAALSVLGYLLLNEGKFTEARPFVTRSVTIQEHFLPPDHPNIAQALVVDGSLLTDLGDLDAGRTRLERACSIYDRALGPDKHEALWCHTELARNLRLSGRGEEAAALYAANEAVLDGTPGLEITHLNTLFGLAAVRADAGDVAGAERAVLAAARIGREQFALYAGGLPERQALTLSSATPWGWDLALSLAVAHPASARTRAAWDALVRSRALVLDEMASRRRLAAGDGDAESAALRAQFEAARTRLARLTVRGIASDTPERYAERLRAARDEKERDEAALAAKSAAFRRAQAWRGVSLGDVEDALPAGAALVAYAIHDPSAWDRTPPAPGGVARAPRRTYTALVLRAASEPVAVPLGPAEEIERLVAAWRVEAAAKPAAVKAPARDADERARRAGEALRRAVWDPLARHVGGAKQVFVVPDGALHLVNLATLPAPNGRYLVERGPVIQLLSAERDLARPPGPAGGGTPTLLALGAPDFDRAPASGAEVLRLARASAPAALPSALADTYRGPRASCGDFRSLRFEALPASKLEADEVTAIWSAHEGSRDAALELTGPAAHEALFKQLAPSRSIVHLATHGFYLEPKCLSAGGTASPLLSSGLALAGANHRDDAGPGEEDGILTAEEIASLDLSGVDWVVLSACNTGVGQVMNGEGVLGLRRAFEVAGAGTLIMSLWPVQDEASRAWMRALYEARLNGSTTADAVRQASLRTLEERRRAGLSTHPFYWGAFVAAGEWR